MKNFFSTKSLSKDKINLIYKSSLFDVKYYNSLIKKDLNSNEAFNHYINNGIAHWISPNKYFDFSWYKSICPKYLDNPIDILIDYYLYGWKQGKHPSEKFDITRYLSDYEDLLDAGVEPLAHFLWFGKSEGRNIYPVNKNDIFYKIQEIVNARIFLSQWYISKYSDMKNEENPLLHYILHGESEGRFPNPYFDPVYYKKKYLKKSDTLKSNNVLTHYLRKGRFLGYNPSKYFNISSYIMKYHNKSINNQEALSHYLLNGASWLNNEVSYDISNPDYKIIIPSVNKFNDIYSLVPKYIWQSDVINHPTKSEKGDEKGSFNPNKLYIHWIIPDFAPTGGGHINIFRVIKLLELLGHKQYIWISTRMSNRSSYDALNMILKNFEVLGSSIEYLDQLKYTISGDIVVATDFTTVSYAKCLGDFKRTFYFVQDYEPFFHPVGSNYLIAKETYNQDIDCICAGTWLKDKMKKHGRWSTSFPLAADPSFYFRDKLEKKNRIPRIVFYARISTSRRSVELGLLALIRLYEEGVIFHVDLLLGQTLSETEELPFSYISYDNLSHKELGNIYRKSDIGLVLSATNYSLMPQEMMACGLPVVELNTESTLAVFPTQVISLAFPNSKSISEKIKTLLDNDLLRKNQVIEAFKWISTFSWEKSADIISSAFINRLIDLGFSIENQESKKKDIDIEASIVIPMFNAANDVDILLPKLINQRAPWNYEIIIIDSQSTDSTIKRLSLYEGIKIIHINKVDFNHGQTRNLGAKHANGKFIAFLTQDAYPISNTWLYDLVSTLKQYPNSAGVFGRHIARSDADPYTVYDINSHFDSFNKLPLEIDNTTEIHKNSENYEYIRQVSHFYSDNNSCMKKSVWEKIPYQKTMFGEDQLWAEEVLKLGFSKIYAPNVIVEHSHDFGEKEIFDRSRIESSFFREKFGYQLISPLITEEEILQLIKKKNYTDSEWGLSKKLDISIIENRKKLNKSFILGLIAGVKEDETLY